MSKTNDPHPDSFHAFACWTAEEVAAVRTFLPWDIPPQLFADALQNEVAEPFLRSQARRHGAVMAALVEVERDRALKAGLSTAWLDTPQGAAYLAENAEQLAGCVSLAERNDIHVHGVSVDGVFRPQRSTVADVIVGVHIGIAGCKRLETATLLNRGIPERDARSRVTPSEVRNALDTFLKRRVRGFKNTFRLASFCACKARVLNRLWLDMPKSRLPGSRAYDVAQWRAHTGELFDDFERLYIEEPVHLPCGSELFPVVQDLIRRKRRDEDRARALRAA